MGQRQPDGIDQDCQPCYWLWHFSGLGVMGGLRPVKLVSCKDAAC